MKTVTETVAQDPTLYKSAATAVGAGGTAIAQINEYLTFVAILISIIAGSIAIYKFIDDIRNNKDKE